MKRLISFILAAALLLCFCGCSKTHADCVQSNISRGFNHIGGIMYSGSGYYYNYSDDFSLSLHYYDCATKKTIFLCSKPECPHDGNVYCNATSSKYLLNDMAYYEDEIYLTVKEYDESKNRLDFKLLKAARDGTALTEVATYASMTNNVNSFFVSERLGLSIHRGKAFCCFDFSDAEMVTVRGVTEVDITTGRSKEIARLETNGSFENFVAAGDDVYFIAFRNDFYKNVYHYSMKTGETKIIGEYNSQIFINDSAVINGKLFYSYCEYNKQGTEQIKKEMAAYSPETDEITTWELKDEDVEWDGLTFDGKYIYLSDHEFHSGVRRDNGVIKVAILNTKWEKLSEFEVIIAGTEALEKDQVMGYALNIIDDYMYLSYKNCIKKCKLSGALKGEPEWTDEVYFEEVENIA